MTETVILHNIHHLVQQKKKQNEDVYKVYLHHICKQYVSHLNDILKAILLKDNMLCKQNIRNAHVKKTTEDQYGVEINYTIYTLFEKLENTLAALLNYVLHSIYI